MLAGAVLTAARPGLTAIHETSVADIPRALAHLEPSGFFDLGLLLLLATPVARVIALLFGFARERKWLLSSFSLIVLVALAFSAYLGLRV